MGFMHTHTHTHTQTHTHRHSLSSASPGEGESASPSSAGGLAVFNKDGDMIVLSQVKGGYLSLLDSGSLKFLEVVKVRNGGERVGEQRHHRSSLRAFILSELSCLFSPPLTPNLLGPFRNPICRFRT